MTGGVVAPAVLAGRERVVWGAVFAVCIGVVFAGLRTAQFLGDDWHYLALLRHIDSPVDIFVTNISGAYLYRPLVLFSFWLSERLASPSAPLQYGINVLLHCWVAAEVYAFARYATQAPRLAAWTALLFAVLPSVAGTPLWVSDRFDLLATAAMLHSLRCVALWTARRETSAALLWRGALALVVALGSKEIGYALVPALALLLLLAHAREAGERVRAMLLIAALSAVCLLARFNALDGLRGDASLELSTARVVLGVTSWLAGSIKALQLHQGYVGLGLLLLIVLLFARPRPGMTLLRAVHRAEVYALLTLLAGIALAQSPLAAGVLPQEGATLNIVTLRFYYAAQAVAAVLLAIAGAMLAPPTRWQRAGATLCAAAAVAWSVAGSAAQTAQWTAVTQAEHNAVAPALRAYEAGARALTAGAPCVVALTPGLHSTTDLDLRFKAHTARGDARVNCALLTTPPQIQTITRISPCDPQGILPARSAVPELPPMRRSGTCTYLALRAAPAL